MGAKIISRTFCCATCWIRRPHVLLVCAFKERLLDEMKLEEGEEVDENGVTISSKRVCHFNYVPVKPLY